MLVEDVGFTEGQDEPPAGGSGRHHHTSSQGTEQEGQGEQNCGAGWSRCSFPFSGISRNLVEF